MANRHRSLSFLLAPIRSLLFLDILEFLQSTVDLLLSGAIPLQDSLIHLTVLELEAI